MNPAPSLLSCQEGLCFVAELCKSQKRIDTNPLAGRMDFNCVFSGFAWSSALQRRTQRLSLLTKVSKYVFAKLKFTVGLPAVAPRVSPQSCSIIIRHINSTHLALVYITHAFGQLCPIWGPKNRGHPLKSWTFGRRAIALHSLFTLHP